MLLLDDLCGCGWEYWMLCKALVRGHLPFPSHSLPSHTHIISYNDHEKRLTSLFAGFGMILLQTLTRFHVLFVLIAAQVLGSAATMVARATAPDKVGPGSVFPNLCVNPREGLSQAWFWVALMFQLAVPVGFAVFFRKEQLSKA